MTYDEAFEEAKKIYSDDLNNGAKMDVIDWIADVLMKRGCQCDDRIGETKIWCCNQCGLPVEKDWLQTKKPML